MHVLLSPPQAVSVIMQQLLHCLLSQQHLSRIQAALGLLLNCTVAAQSTGPAPVGSTADISSSAPATAAAVAAAAAAGAVAVRSGGSGGSSSALQLVQLHLLGFLLPRDLASEELQLPVLAALRQAASGGWGEGVLPLTALLAACCPSNRCLETLLGMVQVG